MPATYEPIATTTLSSAAASITFSSISSAYTDLRIIWNGTMETSNAILKMQFNSDTASNYSATWMYGDGTSAASSRTTSSTAIDIGGASISLSSTVPSLVTVDVFNYAGSTYKTSLATTSNDKNGTGYVERNVGLWRATSAITTIKIFRSGVNNFATGTTATLYGILRA